MRCRLTLAEKGLKSGERRQGHGNWGSFGDYSGRRAAGEDWKERLDVQKAACRHTRHESTRRESNVKIKQKLETNSQQKLYKERRQEKKKTEENQVQISKSKVTLVRPSTNGS